MEDTLTVLLDGYLGPLGTQCPKTLLHVNDPDTPQRIGVGTCKPDCPLHFQIAISATEHEDMRVTADEITIGGLPASDADVVAFLKRLTTHTFEGELVDEVEEK